MLKRPCRFYNTTGKCRFGERCKFAHELLFEQKQDLHQNQDEIPVSEADSSATLEGLDHLYLPEQPAKENEGLKREKNLKSSKKICEFYAKHRFCKYGKRCKYQHVRRGKQPHNKSNASDDLKKNHQNDDQSQVQDETAYDGEKEDGNEPSIEAKESEEIVDEVTKGVRNICFFYKRGFCKFGNRCRYYHPKEESKDDSCNGNKEEDSNNAVLANAHDESWKPVSRPPRVIHIYKRSEVAQDKVLELRNLEIANLKRRFPSSSLKTHEGLNETEDGFTFTFVPSDPDWPFDVKTFKVEIVFPEDYPMKIFSLRLPCDQDLPETVRRYIEVTIQEWALQKQQDSERKDCLEPLLKPFLRWLDRTAESTVTEALRQLRRELAASAAGLQFISAKELKHELKSSTEHEQRSSDDFSSDENQLDDAEHTPGFMECEMTVYQKGEIDEDEVYMGPSKTEVTDDEEEEYESDEEEKEGGNDQGITSRVHQRPMIDLDTPRRGTEMLFRAKEVYFMTTLLVEKLRLSVQCERCKHVTDFSTPPNRVNSIQCAKCHAFMLAVYRPVLFHCYSLTFGYLDLDACVAHDVILQDCHMSIGCIKCNQDMLVKKYSPGQMLERNCRFCHTKLKFSVDSVKLTKVSTSSVDASDYSGKVFQVDVKQIRRAVKDPAIQEGRPLPDNGVCKHYKKSYRWFRFPCCGKCYPCDVCHDSNEDHEMKYANRMICGYCCHEQPYSNDRPCVGCSSALTRVRTAHWEGGRGCRDKVTMSCTDDKKYANMNKTVSNRAKLLEEKKRRKKKSK